MRCVWRGICWIKMLLKVGQCWQKCACMQIGWSLQHLLHQPSTLLTNKGILISGSWEMQSSIDLGPLKFSQFLCSMRLLTTVGHHTVVHNSYLHGILVTTLIQYLISCIHVLYDYCHLLSSRLLWMKCCYEWLSTMLPCTANKCHTPCPQVLSVPCLAAIERACLCGVILTMLCYQQAVLLVSSLDMPLRKY